MRSLLCSILWISLLCISSAATLTVKVARRRAPNPLSRKVRICAVQEVGFFQQKGVPWAQSKFACNETSPDVIAPDALGNFNSITGYLPKVMHPLHPLFCTDWVDFPVSL